MKRSIQTFILFFQIMVIVSPGITGDINIAADASGLQIENSQIRIIFRFTSPEEPSSLRLISFYYKPLQKELLNFSENLPWFEVSINHQIVTNLLPIWNHVSHSTRELANGGVEVRYILTAEKAPFKGLNLVMVIQMFPNYSDIRQKLEIDAEKKADLRLTKYEGKVLLKFPQYSFGVSPDVEFQSEEIRMATWRAELIPDSPYQTSYDERLEEKDWRKGRNLAENYMYHPQKISRKIRVGDNGTYKGPVLLFFSPNQRLGWFISYEHGSPDNDSAENFIDIAQKRTNNSSVVSINYHKGVYFDNEKILPQRGFSTVWAEVGIYRGPGLESGEKAVWYFIYNWLAENPGSRKPLIYYNTWGMQRDAQRKGKDIRGVLTLSRVLKEIEYASQLGVDLFVLDDGWQGKWGDWLPDSKKFPDGLTPVCQALVQRGMKLGVWLGVLAADSDAVVVKEHPEWLIRDENGKPIVGRWNRYVLCFVSDFRNYFVEVGKRLIDAGVRYFKWDGIDNYRCDSPSHDHGDSNQSPDERALRHRYELIRYITDAARELIKYNQEVVIEMDVTEPGRSVGLAFLSTGRFFWMNNGASWYGDRSHYRAKSMRMIPALFSFFLPTVLQTYANYPHNHPVYMAQRYNVNTSLLGGNGFWGDLSDMRETERMQVGEIVRLAKRVKETVSSTRPQIIGRVGSSPEIYTFFDPQKSEGQIIGFSGSALNYLYKIPDFPVNKLLAVVRNSYKFSGDTLILPLRFPMPDVSREALIFSNKDTGISIVSSTSWLKDAYLKENNQLVFINGAPGIHTLRWPVQLGKPAIRYSSPVKVAINKVKAANFYKIRIETLQQNTEIVVSNES